MRSLRALAFVLVALVALTWLLDGPALSASNTVPASRIAVRAQPITANDLKPWQCSATVTSIVIGSGNIRGTGGSELVLGSAGKDVINARGGHDCVVSGAGADEIDGGSGWDVCVGTAATSKFRRCEQRFP